MSTPPIGKFNVNVDRGLIPLTVTFTNISEGNYTSAEWDFGDGNKSTDINPTHTYKVAGNYTVTLTVRDSINNTNTYSKTVIALANYNTSASTEVEQQSLYTYKRFNASQIQVRRVTTTGSTFESDVPIEVSGAGRILNMAIVASALTPTNELTGATTLQYSAETADFVGYMEALTANSSGVLAMVLASPGQNATTLQGWNDVFFNSGSLLTGSPVLFYKVTGFDSGTTTITVDRKTLLGYTQAESYYPIYIFGNTGSTAVYGQENDLGSNSNVVADLTHDGDPTFKFGNMPYATAETAYNRGVAAYFGYTAATGSPVAFISYEHSASTTVERWYPGELEFVIPWVMWHKNTNQVGVRLYDSADPTSIDAATGLRYRKLRDGRTTNNNVVGKVFYDKRMMVIDDPELAIVLCYTSNRSWTFPAPELRFVESSTNSWTHRLPGEVTYYYMYRVYEKAVIASTSAYGIGFSVNFPPCQYVASITVPEKSASDIPMSGYLQMSIPTLVWATGGTDCIISGTSKLGYIADTLEMYAATGDTTGPDMNSWIQLDGIGAEAIYSAKVASDTIVDIIDTSGYMYFSGNAYDYDIPFSGNDNLYIGQEPSVWGYFSGVYASDVYKMAASCVATNNEFNKTQNKTYTDGSNDYTYITEVGLYNENDELLMIGKLSKPIQKNNTKYVIVQLEIDL